MKSKLLSAMGLGVVVLGASQAAMAGGASLGVNVGRTFFEDGSYGRHEQHERFLSGRSSKVMPVVKRLTHKGITEVEMKNKLMAAVGLGIAILGVSQPAIAGGVSLGLDIVRLILEDGSHGHRKQHDAYLPRHSSEVMPLVKKMTHHRNDTAPSGFDATQRRSFTRVGLRQHTKIHPAQVRETDTRSHTINGSWKRLSARSERSNQSAVRLRG